jgi:hypothetical protein
MDVLFNKDLVKVILTNCNYDDLLSYCLTHRDIKDILQDRVFWEEKAFHDFNYPINIFRQSVLSPTNKYKQICILYKGAEDIIRWDQFVMLAIKNNREDLIKYAKNKGYNYCHRKEYAYIGKIFNITNFNDYFDTLCGALEGKQYKDYNELKDMSFYKNIGPYLLDKMLASIAFSGNINLFDEILEKHKVIIDDYNFGVISTSAISNNQKLMYDHLLTLLGSPDIHYIESLSIALKNNNFDLYEYIFKSIDSRDFIIGSGVIATLLILKERMDLFDQLMNHDKIDNNNWNWTHLICDSIETFNPNIYDHVLRCVPKDYVYLYDFDSEETSNDPEYERISGFNWMYILYDLIIRSSFRPEILNYVINHLAPKGYKWDSLSIIL